MALRVTLATGKFTGSFVHPITHKMTTFGGLFLQPPENDAGGFFLTPTASGSVTLTP